MMLSAWKLAEYPVFFIDQLHQIDALDFHGVADAGNFAEAADAGFFGDDRVAVTLARR